MSDRAEMKRYVVKRNDDAPHPSLYRYSHVVMDTTENRPVAYASPQQTADDYCEQMNEKGFIEP